jgi:hypothetical protein
VSTIAERVTKGAALLDEREPGWWQRINLDTLDLWSPCKCVLGQLATHLGDDWEWHTIVAQFGLRPWTDADHGFNADGVQTKEQYDALTAEWKRVITERREAGAQ